MDKTTFDNAVLIIAKISELTLSLKQWNQATNTHTLPSFAIAICKNWTQKAFDKAKADSIDYLTREITELEHQLKKIYKRDRDG